MKESKIVFENGNPSLVVDGKKMPALAYMTYFEENNDYALFAQNGYRLFSVPVALAHQPINPNSGFCPHFGGIFDEKGKADFTIVDASIQRIVDACPEAYIFPRVYISMPQWWIDDNPTETVSVAHDKRREALYSQKFREDAAKMLTELLVHFKTFQYADHMIGYHIAGGGTEEWFHFDYTGSYHENALPYFSKYMSETIEKLPDLAQIQQSAVITDTLLQKYILFANECVAETIEYLCKAAKSALENRQIVGVFHGYDMEVARPLWGTHALHKLLDCPYVDFFSSPNSYVNGRSLGVDWPDMMPVDSILLHGKMCLIECDVRTYRTVLPSKAREGCDPYHSYTQGLWNGPPTEELSVFAVRKSLARQLTHKHGLWWFDMFGHWYNTHALMKEMHLAQKLYHMGHTDDTGYAPEVAVFVDEETYARIGQAHPQYKLTENMREHFGKMGTPFSAYITHDFDKIRWDDTSYKAVLFLMPEGDAFVSKAQALLKQKKIATLYVTELMTGECLRRFLRASGVWIFSDSDDVVYFGNGFAALHGAAEGEKTISLPKEMTCTDVISNETQITNKLTFDCRQYETRIFALKERK